jgi:hypothetical protein
VLICDVQFDADSVNEAEARVRCTAYKVLNGICAAVSNVFTARNAIALAPGATYNLNMCASCSARHDRKVRQPDRMSPLFALPAPADAIGFHVGSRGGQSRQGLSRQGLSAGLQ